MIQPQTNLKVADNTGAKIIQCFRVLGGTRKRYAQIGDVIIPTRETITFRIVNKGCPIKVIVEKIIPMDRQNETSNTTTIEDGVYNEGFFKHSEVYYLDFKTCIDGICND